MVTPLTTTQNVRLVIADDHELFRETLAERLRMERDIDVIGTAADANETIDLVSRMKPDMVLMDLDMPGRQAFDAVRTAKSISPETDFVVLSAHMTDFFIVQAIEAGCSGYLLKAESVEQLLSSMRSIADGNEAFSPQVEQRIIRDSRGQRSARVSTRAASLSRRELEVLGYIARGMSKKQIAAAMHISVKTVDNHSTSLMSKLDLHDRVELTRFAIRERLAEP